MVALERGAKLKRNEYGYWLEATEADADIAIQALLDVVEWLGYPTVGRYLDDLGTMKEKIFLRAA